MSQHYSVEVPSRPGVATAAIALAAPAAAVLLAASVVFPVKTWGALGGGFGFDHGLCAIFSWIVVVLAWLFTYVAVRGCWQYLRGSGARKLAMTFGWLVIGGGGFTVEAIEHPDPSPSTWIVGIGLIVWGLAGGALITSARTSGWPPRRVQKQQVGGL